MKKFFIILAFLAALIGFLPTILSTPWGTQVIGKFFPSEVRIESLSLSWLGPQKAEGITLTDGNVKASIPSAKVDTTFFSLLLKKYGEVTFENATATIGNDVSFTDVALSFRTSEDFHLSGQSSGGPFTLVRENNGVQLEATNFPAIDADKLLALITKKYHGLLPEILGERVSLRVSGTYSSDTISGTVQITSPLLTTAFSADTVDGNVILQEKASFKWRDIQGEVESLLIPYANHEFDMSGLVTQLQLDIATLPYPEYLGASASINLSAHDGVVTLLATTPKLTLPTSTFTLTDSLVLQDKAIVQYGESTIHLDTLTVPLANWERASATGSIQTENITIEGVAIHSADIEFKAHPLTDISVNGNATVTLTHHPITLTSLTGHLLANEKTTFSFSGALAEGGTIDLLATQTDHLNIKLTLSNIRSLLLDLHPQIVGETISIDTQIDQKFIDLAVKSPYLELKGAFDRSEEFRLKKGSQVTFQWLATPEVYAAIELPVALSAPAKINGVISALSLPIEDSTKLLPKIDFNPYKSSFAMHTTSDSIAFSEATMRDVSCELSKERGSGPLYFDASATVTPGNGVIKAKGRFDDLFAESGSINYNALTTHVDATLRDIPTSILDSLTLSNVPSSVLGQEVHATLSSDNTSVQIKLDATQCQATLDGKLENGMLLLNKPLRGSCVITQKLASLFTNEITVTAAKSPATFYIDNRNFSLPLRDFNACTIPYFRLDLGQLAIRNKGPAKKLSKFLHLGQTETIHFWFAPCEGRVSRGKVRIDRTEALIARRYQLALWGDVNLGREYVDMILGIPARTMKAALGINPPSSNYVLKVPLRGPYNNIALDTDAVKQKMALMMAGRAARSLIPGGSPFGGVLDAASSLMDDQGDVPPPKRPFPWERQTGENKAQQFNKQRIKRKSKSNFKELKKIVSSQTK